MDVDMFSMSPAERRAVHDKWVADRDRWLKSYLTMWKRRYGDRAMCLKMIHQNGVWAGRVIAPSVNQLGYWQSTLFHADGLFSHSNHLTVEEALEDAYSSGFREVDPAWVDRVFLSPAFIEGNRRAEAMMAEHEARMRAFHAKWLAEHPEEDNGKEKATQTT